jgi:hypothetical protein
MRLADLRKISIRQQVRLRFRLENGMECVITEHGVAQVPGLRSAPSFNLEQELAGAGQFIMESAAPAGQPRPLSRADLEAMVSAAGSGGAASAPDHEDD